jgi:glutaredoxin
MIELYTRPGCTYCDKAKGMLRSIGASYTEHVVDVNISRKELLEQFPTAKTLPIVVINGVHIGGYPQLEQQIVEQREHIGKSFLAE